jgi:hypothetical protein
MGTSLS